MALNQKQVSLGFTNQLVPEGTHMCLVFSTQEELTNSLLSFLLSGLKNNECTSCYSETISEEEIKQYLIENDISYNELKKHHAISLSGTNENYFKNGEFNPERMLNNIIQFYQDARLNGFKSSRIIGEMTPLVKSVPGGERLMEYESRVSILLRDYPVTTVCLYDANEFDGATIMEVLKVHPQMIVHGTVVKNPFYIEPEEYLEEVAKKPHD